MCPNDWLNIDGMKLNQRVSPNFSLSNMGTLHREGREEWLLPAGEGLCQVSRYLSWILNDTWNLEELTLRKEVTIWTKEELKSCQFFHQCTSLPSGLGVSHCTLRGGATLSRKESFQVRQSSYLCWHRRRSSFVPIFTSQNGTIQDDASLWKRKDSRAV